MNKIQKLLTVGDYVYSANNGKPMRVISIGFPQSFIDNLLGPKDEDSLGVICMEEVLGCRKQ